EVLRCLEDATPLLDLLVERALGALALGDVLRDLARADDLSGRRAQRVDCEHYVNHLAILAKPLGLALFDGLAAADPLEIVVHFAAPLFRHDHPDMLADRLCRGKAEQPFGRLV